MEKQYNILLDGKRIGTTALEHADPPMGMVFGDVVFDGISAGYQFLKDYCMVNGITLMEDDPADGFIVTAVIPALKIVTEEGKDITAEGVHIDGVDAAGFQVYINGVPSSLMEEEFQHHIDKYNNLYN